jgi:predicted nucleic acid-binding protein
VNRLVVLDASAFDGLDGVRGERLRALLESTGEHGGRVLCAAATLAEVCRTAALTRRAEVALQRGHGGHRIEVVPTDLQLAKQVGQLLGDARRGSCYLADAHVVALCSGEERAVVITSDPDDINHIAASLPGVRVVTRRP